MPVPMWNQLSSHTWALTHLLCLGFVQETFLITQPPYHAFSQTKIPLAAFSTLQLHEHVLLTHPALGASHLSLLITNFSMAVKFTQPKYSIHWALYCAVTIPKSICSFSQAWGATLSNVHSKTDSLNEHHVWGVFQTSLDQFWTFATSQHLQIFFFKASLKMQKHLFILCRALCVIQRLQQSRICSDLSAFEHSLCFDTKPHGKDKNPTDSRCFG